MTFSEKIKNHILLLHEYPAVQSVLMDLPLKSDSVDLVLSE